jgi:regulator of replication initiation timing
MATKILSLLSKLIGELPTNSVLRERAAFLKEQVEAMEKRASELEQENRDLRRKLGELESEQASRLMTKEFVEHRGALFKHKPEGGYHRAVFCPTCKRSTSSLQNMLPYHCAPCEWSADFTGHDLDQVMKELP